MNYFVYLSLSTFLLNYQNVIIFYIEITCRIWKIKESFTGRIEVNNSAN